MTVAGNRLHKPDRARKVGGRSLMDLEAVTLLPGFDEDHQTLPQRRAVVTRYFSQPTCLSSSGVAGR